MAIVGWLGGPRHKHFLISGSRLMELALYETLLGVMAEGKFSQAIRHSSLEVTHASFTYNSLDRTNHMVPGNHKGFWYV